MVKSQCVTIFSESEEHKDYDSLAKKIKKKRVHYKNTTYTKYYKNDVIKVGDLSLDLKKVEVKVKGEVINLTKKEFDVLKYLASQPGQVVTREMLLREVWEYEEYVGAIRTIDVTMNRIRDKIEKDKANPKILITKRGVGYYVTDKN